MDGWYAQPVGTANTPALAPFKTGAELAERSLAIFTSLDPALGRDFKTMIDEGLLDLENKRGKAPGAYCTAFEVVRRPYILMNAIGTHDDVQTMLHEAGHAFHEFAYAGLPHPGQRAIPMEFAEVASMGMELLAAPFLAREHGGFYSKAEAARAQIEHLERSILFWPFMAVVDLFQHWVYENPTDASNGERASAHWDTLWQKFIPAVDYSGFESYRASGWQRKQHIFNAPFYYVEYGLAQLGAQQVWQRSLAAPAKALRQYREALSLGGTVALPELFRIAGGKLSFDKQTLKDAVEFASAQIRKLRLGA
jgi:oligoendopeptidase F